MVNSSVTEDIKRRGFANGGASGLTREEFHELRDRTVSVFAKLDRNTSLFIAIIRRRRSSDPSS